MNKSSPFIHSIEPRDPIEVDSPHGRGIVLYITVYGVHGNDMWCVANKEDGRMRHYETTQLKLAFNGALDLNRLPARTVLRTNGTGSR
jgi:hypothetical protein